MHSLPTSIQALVEQYPLPEHWKISQTVQDEISCQNGHTLMRVGIAATSPSHPEITGSAAGSNGDEILRATFELLERIAILETDSAPEPKDSTAPYRHARSNGVAAHTNREEAKKKAALELLERDTVLRSWYGVSSAPIPIQVPLSVYLASDRLRPSFFLLGTPSDAGQTHWVILCTLQDSQMQGMRYGFGISPLLEAAASKAYSEAIQQWAFTADEPADATPSFAPTALFHLDTYLNVKNQKRIHAWLAGKNRFLRDYVRLPKPGAHEWTYTDITPAHWINKMSVIRAHSKAILPLVFGKDLVNTLPGFPASHLIHPIV